MARPVLTLPGLHGSGPSHWQSLWERRREGVTRVRQRDWARPEREFWVASLESAIAACAEPPVLAAHSLGCITAVFWAFSGSNAAISGALLVSPTDTEREDAPPEIAGFRPIPMHRLPFPSILVVSSTDPYLSVERSFGFARAWGSRRVEIGPGGHINAASGFGPWPQGEALLDELL
ncbi:MAG: alpha/beta hydrolase [Acidobacteriota bacterium]